MDEIDRPERAGSGGYQPVENGQGEPSRRASFGLVAVNFSLVSASLGVLAAGGSGVQERAG